MVSLLLTELIFETKPSINRQQIFSRFKELFDSDPEMPEDSEMLMMFHKKYSVEYKDGAMPPQTVLFENENVFNPNEYEEEILQSWYCEDADELVKRCKYSVLVTEMMSNALKPETRLDLFHYTLQACIEILKPVAMIFKKSSQVIEAQNYLSLCDESPYLRPGVFNVRFYNISNHNEGDMLMDTRGLNEIGLPDLQCHFNGLDPSEVANQIGNLAIYILENGNVFENGHTVEGLSNETWTCQFENSLLEPKRNVIDLNPGEKYAAGNRS